MKKLFTENMGLKIASVAIAFFLWILIVYTYDPAATASFTLGVNIINGETIASSGKVYEVIEGDTITIKVKANASLIKNLKASDFKATADVSKLSPTNHANIDVVCTKSDNVEITIIGSAKLLAVRLEDLVTKQFSVTVEKSGEAEAGYYVGEAIPSPNLITVSGGKKSVEKISSVKAKVDISGVHSTFYADAVPKAYDADGNEITTGSLTFSSNPVNVSVKIYKTKKIAVFVEAVGEVYQGYSVQDINYEPKSITVAASDEVLEEISSVTLPLDIYGKITDVEASLNIAEALPTGVYLVDKDAVVNVKCNIVRIGTKEFDILPSDIKLINMSDELIYEVVDTELIKIVFNGIAEKLESASLEAAEPYIDLSTAREAGNYSFVVQFKTIDGVTVSDVKPITIKVTEKAGAADVETSTGGAVSTGEEDSANEENTSRDNTEGAADTTEGTAGEEETGAVEE